jgi:hypothetical protein
MRKFVRHLAAVAAAAVAPVVLVTVAAPGVAAADDCIGGRTWDPVAKMCTPPPPVPTWYQPAPAYAQSWAPPWAPPPPPPPPYAVQFDLKPVWNPGTNQWEYIYVR